MLLFSGHFSGPLGLEEIHEGSKHRPSFALVLAYSKWGDAGAGRADEPSCPVVVMQVSFVTIVSVLVASGT